MAELKKFKCKGSIGLYYGMGIDEVEIDFTDMNGLITLAGPNGMGKSTLLEMLSPFHTFPSRQLKDPRRYSYKAQFKDRDSFKEVTYQHLGKEYVFRIEVPAGTTMSPEGYVTCDGQPLVKGKISEYKKVVAELFGSEKLFYSSIFSCQNGKKLTDLPVGEFKQLLIELLGLERYTEMWKNIKPAMDVCEQELKAVEQEQGLLSKSAAEIDENKACINTSMDQMTQAETRLNETLERITETKVHIKGLQEKLEKARQDEFIIQEKTKSLEGIRAERAEVDKQINEAKQKHEDRHAAILMQQQPYYELAKQREEIENATAEIERLNALETHLNALIDNIRRTERLTQYAVTDYEREISDLKEQRYKLEADPELKRLDTLLTELEKNLSAHMAAQTERKQWLKDLDNDPVVTSLKRDMEGYAQAEALLNKRPDACTIDDCPFIKNALDAIEQKAEKGKLLATEQARVQDRRDVVEREIENLEEEITLTENEISRATAKRKEAEKDIGERTKEINGQITFKDEHVTRLNRQLIQSQDEMEGYQAEINQIPTKIQALEELAGKAADLDQASRRLEEINQAIVDHNQEYADTAVSLNEKWGDLHERVAAVKEEINKIKDSAVPRPLVEEGIATTQKTIDGLESRRQDHRDRITTLKQKIETCRENIGKLQKDADRIEELKAREQFTRQEINRWTYARAAVSKSGLQALEIASAAPLLTSLANDLLHAAFGGEFFVDLITEDPETGAEILDVMVTREDGQTFPLASYSGGESVWLLQAFKSAQILVNAEKSGVQFMTAFADEETGQLDIEKAERFIKMYRALMTQGGFSKLIYISHIKECQAMADHVLTFEQGGIKAA